MQQLCYTSFLEILPDWLATIAAVEVITIRLLLLFVKKHVPLTSVHLYAKRS